jgi:hypothetical protein
MPYVFDVARARGFHQHRGSGTADTARLPVKGLSAFGGGRKDCKIATGRYPTTRRSGRHEILGPRPARLGTGAREALTVCTAPYLGPTRGAGGGHVQISNAASCRPITASHHKGGLKSMGGYSWPRRKKTWGGGSTVLRQHGADLCDSVSR